MQKKKILSALGALALAGGIVAAGAAPANAVPVKDWGPYPNSGTCNADRTNYIQQHPGQRVTSCQNSMGTGNWWFTVYL
ncbi:MAG: hypothetical protein PIR02_12295 [Microbacterium enclense]